MKHVLAFLLTFLAIVPPSARGGNAFREGDILEMRLSGPPEEFTKEFNITLIVDDGRVNLPLIGRISAAGMTSTQLATTIEQRLKQAKLFTAANVNITPNPNNPRTVIVSGAVRAQGKQNWAPELTLMGAISMAGGPTEYAKDTVKLLRRGKATSYSRKAIEKNPALDPKVEIGDSIVQTGE